MKAAIISGVGQVEVGEIDDPTPGPRDVVLAVAGCGICGTDLHILEGEFAPTLPVVPGHEFAGEVVAVGSAVTEVAVGDQVAVDPSLHCGECYYCRRGRGNLCERWAAIGVTLPGGAAEYAKAPVANCANHIVPMTAHISLRAIHSSGSCAECAVPWHCPGIRRQ